MKVAIFRDTWEPWYDFTESGMVLGVVVDLPTGFIEGYREVAGRMTRMQDTLEKLYMEGRKD